MPQPVHFLKTPDGIRIAWTSGGAGAPLVKASNWMTHLNYDTESPVWRHWVRFFESHFKVVRYDERGCGLSDWDVGDLSPARWEEDLSAVAAVSTPDEPFVLLGISQGAAAAVSYAVSHPERVSKLVLYGGYSLGWAHRGDPEGLRRYEAMAEIVRLGRAIGQDLVPDQVAEVLALILRMKEQGLSVILISHRMPDVFAVCDRIIVMRRGVKVADKQSLTTSPEEITGLITGAIRAA